MTRSGRRGMSMVEVVFAMVLVAGLLVAALTAAGAAKTSRGRTAERARAQQLAMDLLGEILQQNYQDASNTSNYFGLDAGKGTANRAAWSDVDDYDGLVESPPRLRSGGAIADVSSWTRSTAVQWIDPTSLAVTGTSNTGIKRITVSVKRGGLVLASVAGYRTSGWVDTLPRPTDATGNHAPMASMTGSPLSGHASLNVNFDASGSVDVDGDGLSYVWDFGDGSQGTGATISHRYNTVGSYTAKVTVYDGRGGTGVASIVVSVLP